MSKQWKGTAGSPIKLRTNATRQTKDRYSQRQTMPAIDEDDDGYYEEPRPHTSSVRYDRLIRNTAYMDKNNPKKTRRVRERRIVFDQWTLIMAVCILIMVMIGGWWLFTAVSSWWTNWQNDLHYGNPRIYQTDQFTGQGDSPANPDHFIAINLHGRVDVFQINPFHPELDHSYNTITTTDPSTPVNLIFRQTGSTLAMFVVIQTDNPYTIELVSNGKQFVGASS